LPVQEARSVSVKATVVFWRASKAAREWGTYEFAQLPSAGDKIVVRLRGGAENPDGTEDVFEVLKAEHLPATANGETPSVRLLCEWVTGRSG